MDDLELLHAAAISSSAIEASPHPHWISVVAMTTLKTMQMAMMSMKAMLLVVMLAWTIQLAWQRPEPWQLNLGIALVNQFVCICTD